jgi:hypothetical protein
MELIVFVALVIEVLIAPPRAIAASAIAEPTMARISAYSAADAPLSSLKKDVTNLVINKTPY